MATSQWRFEFVGWGAPEEGVERSGYPGERGGLFMDVLNKDTGELAAALILDWLGNPDQFGATCEFTLVDFATERGTFPAWVAKGRLRPQPGGVAITEFSVVPDAPGTSNASLEKAQDYAMNPGDPPPSEWIPGGGITSGLLRKVNLGIVFAAVQSLQGVGDSPEIREWLNDIADRSPDFREAIRMQDKDASSEPQKRGGRPALPDAHLREVALAYLELSGQRGAHALLSERFNKSPSAIKDLIRAARRTGWLAPGQAGRRGAYPGPRLLEERDSTSETEASSDESPVQESPTTEGE